jgi:hypothetical protein
MRHRRQSDTSHTSNSSSDDSDSSGTSTKLDNPQAQSDNVQFNHSRRGSASSSDSSDDYESDSGGNGGHTDTTTMLINAVSGSSVSGRRPVRPLPKRAAPSIVVLSERPGDDEDQV